MRSLESGKDKIQKICDALRLETLEPARQEAKEIIENARLEAAEIVRGAREKIQEFIQTSEQEIERKQKAFHASLQMACRQGIEQLKQKIEQEILFKGLFEAVQEQTADPRFIARLIDDFMKMLAEKGIEEEIVAVVPKSVSARAVNSLLVDRFLNKLKDKTVEFGDFHGGVQLKLKGRRVTIDISDVVIRELIAGFIRNDFRELVFQV